MKINIDKKTSLIVFVLCEIAICCFMLYNIHSSKKQQIDLSKKMILHEARAHFDNIVITRRWNALHGGVYVKQYGDLQPNKYLKDNHFYRGKELYIKINPAWMTRQISEITNRQSKYYYKITSLDPINPKNKADTFEASALKFFEKNKEAKEYYQFANNLQKFDYMGSLKTEQSCLECHGWQGYKVGDIRGGIRVSVPIANYKEDFESLKFKSNTLMSIVIALVIIVGALFIWFINVIFQRQSDIENLSITDSLTSLHNRRHFNIVSQEKINTLKKTHKLLGFLLIDIDYFKGYNDTYGHLAGDKALISVGNAIQQMTNRSTDFAFRIGGEEFGVIFSPESEEKGKFYAECIREKVEQLQIEHKVNKASKFLTISIGACFMNIENDTKMEEIFNKADSCLYKAKENGRNQVITS